MSSANSRDGVLLYVGALVDVRPLVYPFAFVPHVRDYVYVDGLPGSNYYPQYNTKEKLLGEFERRWSLFSFTTFTTKEEVVPDKYVLYTMPDGRRVHYFMNTMDNDLIQDVALPLQLKELLARTTHLYMSGFTPKYDIFKLLPALTHIFSTSICTEVLVTSQMRMWTQVRDYDYDWDLGGNGWIEICDCERRSDDDDDDDDEASGNDVNDDDEPS